MMNMRQASKGVIPKDLSSRRRRDDGLAVAGVAGSFGGHHRRGRPNALPCCSWARASVPAAGGLKGRAPGWN